MTAKDIVGKYSHVKPDQRSWRVLIQDEMRNYDESWFDVEFCNISEKALDRKFYPDYGAAVGHPFTLWTKKRVYFPVEYDGSEWVGSVPRNPCEERINHGVSHRTLGQINQWDLENS